MLTEYKAMFDTPVNRVGTASVKWDSNQKLFGGDVLPMWIADMDFKTDPKIIEALHKRVDHGIFGYTFITDEDNKIKTDWLKRRNNIDVTADQLVLTPGVVDSLYFILMALFEPKDKILIMPPVYGPFFSTVKKADMTLVEAPLIKGDKWSINYELVENEFKKGDIKAIIFCNPHNPTGRMWTEEELKALVKLCNSYNVKIISDDIHKDFTLDHTYTPIINLEGGEEAILLFSATKTFNLAGLRCSDIIVKNEEERNKIKAIMEKFNVTKPGLLSLTAQRAAYEFGDLWLDQLNLYLIENRDTAYDMLNAIPGVATKKIEGTYLQFVDFTQLGLDEDTLYDKLCKGGIGLNRGSFFGELGKGYARMNLATQKATVIKGCEIIEKIVKAL